MKRFYKLGFVALLSFLAVNAFAQSPLTWGVKAGVNLSNVSEKDSGSDIKAKVGFQAGVTVDYAITDAFYLQSGLSFTTKGAKEEDSYSEDGVNITLKGTLNMMYIQLPIMAAYKINVAEGTKIVFNAGPYLAYGVGGKSKVEISANGKTENIEVDTFSDVAFKRFDFGVGAGVGAEFGPIVVGLNYELGLANLAPEGGNLKNRNASLTVGYKF